MSLKPKIIGEQYNSLVPVKGYPQPTREFDVWTIVMAWRIKTSLMSTSVPANKEVASLKLPAPWNVDVLFKDHVCKSITVAEITPLISEITVTYIPPDDAIDFSDPAAEEWTTNAIYKEEWINADNITDEDLGLSGSATDKERAAALKKFRAQGKGTIPSAELQMVHTKQNDGAFSIANMTDELGDDVTSPAGVTGSLPADFKWKKINRSLRKVKGGIRTQADTFVLYNKKA